MKNVEQVKQIKTKFYVDFQRHLVLKVGMYLLFIGYVHVPILAVQIYQLFVQSVTYIK